MEGKQFRLRGIRAAAMGLVVMLMMGSIGAFAEGKFEDFIRTHHWLYGEDFTGYLEYDADDWGWRYNNQISGKFEGDLGYAEADLDQDGEKELVTVGIINQYALDSDQEKYIRKRNLRLTVIESDGTSATECVIPMKPLTNALSTADEETGRSNICNRLRVYIYGKKPRIMIESYDFESLRGDGKGIDYSIWEYDGSEIHLSEINDYEGSDSFRFNAKYVVPLAENGLGSVDFSAVDAGDGFIQSAGSYIPIGGQITYTTINREDFYAFEEDTQDTGKRLDVSMTHIFSREELEDGALKKRWEDTADAWQDEYDGPWYEWFASDHMIEASADSNIRSLPSLDGEVIGLLKKGDQSCYMDVSMEDDRGVTWYCVPVGNAYGWISERYTELV